MCLGFVLKSAGTQAGPADTALPGPSISVFGTIHPDIFRLRTPLGSGHRSERVSVASLEPQIRFDAPADALGSLTDRSASVCPSPSSVASLEERFAALADGRVAFEQRFAALTDGPVAFETRFASTDDCPPSFDATLESAMEALASSLRPAPDQTVASANAVAKPVIPRARPRSAPVRRELPRSMTTAAPRSTTSPRVPSTCRAAGGSRPIPGQGERHQERESLRPPPSASRDGTANP
jgi:hypothetical protein